MDFNLKKIASFDPASQKNIGWSLCEVLCKDGKFDITRCVADTFVMDEYDNRWACYWPMFQKIEQFLSENKPDILIMEKTSVFAGGFVTGQVAQCMGAIFVAAGKYGIKDIVFVYPTSVKKTVAGHGKSTKSQIKRAVNYLTKSFECGQSKLSSDHAYDAVANILFYLIEEKYIDPLTSFPWLTAKQLKTRKNNGKVKKT
jgi:Holliday junction resolvasome RuvABC endonuclease subunit